MSSSAAYYFLMSGADPPLWRLRGPCGAPLTPEPEENQSLSMAAAGEQAARSFRLPAVHQWRDGIKRTGPSLPSFTMRRFSAIQL